MKILHSIEMIQENPSYRIKIKNHILLYQFVFSPFLKIWISSQNYTSESHKSQAKYIYTKNALIFIFMLILEAGIIE